MNILKKQQHYVLVFLILSFLSGEIFAANRIIEKAKDKINDALVVSSIKYNYIKDPLLKSLQIKVSSKDGLVTLEGDLNTDTEYMQSVYLALSVDHVIGINTDDLRVKKSTQPLEDATITSMIYGILLREKLFEGEDFNLWPLDVETKEGIVYLSGSLDTKDERDFVLMTAIRIAGDKAVNDKLLKYKR